MKYPESATRLQEVLNEHNMRAQDLVQRTGINKASISQYLKGTHAPSNISAGKMALVFGVSPCWLMGFDVPKYESRNVDLSQQEQDLLWMYRYVDDDAKARIESSIKMEYEQARKKAELASAE